MAVTQPVQGWGHLAASNIYFMKIIVIQNCQVIFFNTSDRKLCFCFLKLEIQPSDGIHLNHFTLISHYRPLKVMCDVCLNNARRLGIKYR